METTYDQDNKDSQEPMSIVPHYSEASYKEAVSLCKKLLAGEIPLESPEIDPALKKMIAFQTHSAQSLYGLIENVYTDIKLDSETFYSQSELLAIVYLSLS